MKILIYQSITTGNNFGDIGMIEGVIRRLLHITNNVQLCVHYISWLPEEIWEWKNVTPVSMGWFSDSNRSLSYIKKIPYLRRYEKQFKYMMLGRGINLSDIRVGNLPDSPTLDAWTREYDAMHVVGMGGLTEYFPDDVWHFCCLTHAFASQGKPVILTGQQLGPFYSQATKDLLQKALQKTEFVGLREPTDSQMFCQQANLDSKSFAVMGDDSFGLPAADLDQVKSFLSRYNLSPEKFLAVNVRLADYAVSDTKYTKKIAHILSNLSRRYNLPLVVVPIALDKGDSDINSGYFLAEAIGGEEIIVLDKPDQLSAKIVKGVLGQAYAAVGGSYHFCTFALSQAVPAICIFDGDYYSQKARGISRFWGDERLALSLNQVDLDEATKQAYELIEDQHFREALHLRAELALKQWEKTFDNQVNKILANY